MQMWNEAFEDIYFLGSLTCITPSLSRGLLALHSRLGRYQRRPRQAL